MYCFCDMISMSSSISNKYLTNSLLQLSSVKVLRSLNQILFLDLILKNLYAVKNLTKNARVA